MCGILGIIAHKESYITHKQYEKALKELFILSEARGKEASGFAMKQDNELVVFKTPYPASTLVKEQIFKGNLKKLFNDPNERIYAVIGHSRLVTNGVEQFSKNNQPVVKKGIVGVHNGIVTNVKRLWNKYYDEEKISDLDTEIILTLLDRFYRDEDHLLNAVVKTFHEIEGMTNISLLFNRLDNLLLATNNGSLYWVASKDGKIFLFSSEKIFLKRVIRHSAIKKYFGKDNIQHLEPNHASLVNLNKMSIDLRSFRDKIDFKNILLREKEAKLNDISVESHAGVMNKSLFDEEIRIIIPKEFSMHVDECNKKIQKLKRCSKCILPETFPLIEYDAEGICNYCHNYLALSFKGLDELDKLVAQYRSNDNNVDCIVGLSGGRDSSFVLHYVKTILKMNPVAFSYDWGMLTDLGRRNQARMCGKLGVEHILVSADIRKKRNYIRKNVVAWLKRPHLGSIPLFMAGDKQYFYHANRVANDFKTDLVIFGENLLETTFFKYGFCDIPPNFQKKKSFSLNIKAKIKLAWFYGKEYLLNPGFINTSIVNTLGAYASFYFIPHRYVNFYNYIPWDEEVITSTLLDQYDWETSPDTKSTWRIGDGTASFYNYIYFIITGFSEHDTFRSNQIREGMISREEALKKIEKENQARFDSIKWYCDVIDIDFENTINRINTIPKLYH